MSRAEHVTNDLKLNLTKLGTEVLLLQEPFAIKNIPISLGLYVRMLFANSATQYSWAAIAITNPNLTVTNLKHLGSDNIIVAEIIKGTSKIYAISGYMSPSQDHTPVLEALSRALDRLK